MKISTKTKKIVAYLSIIILILLPYWIWGDSVKFAPDIFLNEWYKTLFITGVIGLFYKYFIENKITDFNNSNLKRKEIDIIASKIAFVNNSFVDNTKTAEQHITAIKMIIDTSANNYLSIKDKLIELLEFMNTYSEYIGEQKNKQEMEDQIQHKINKLTDLINNLKK